MSWQFFIDVGGTFTDVIARRPDGTLITHKLLSSGVVRGVVEAVSSRGAIQDRRRTHDPKDFWVGYRLRRVVASPQENTTPLQGDGPGSEDELSFRVIRFDNSTGQLWLQPLRSSNEIASDREVVSSSAGFDSLFFNNPNPGSSPLEYELSAGEEAPVLAIRYLMGIGLDAPIGPVELRLGTTRATNALLERNGAKVALVTTRGLGDVLKIGYQDRPALFELNIRKRDELATLVVQVDERVNAAGEVVHSLDEDGVRKQLADARAAGIETLAICLLHAHVPCRDGASHEDIVARLARSVGFAHVSVSSRIARIEKFVPRADTTVVDAYLAPVIQDYVASLRRSMPEARLWLMASHGGLIRDDRASGIDTILSGPAGGVVGCAHVARQAGLDKTIAFDMGGTSTDVSRIDPAPRHGISAAGQRDPSSDDDDQFELTSGFEYTYETVKDGVRLMIPMLAVETVAAGGGSCCAFDGQKLVVGPQSAGAVPGPACYGRGGPLTVTDMNLFLGRIAGDFFPFPLRRDIVEKKLLELCAEVRQATGSELGLVELAEGFLQIANEKMAAAIKRISIAKGFDVADYTLTTFGGAGAQHACALARILGIRRILCSPFAGVLSAVGMSAATIKRIGQRSVLYRIDGDRISTLPGEKGQREAHGSLMAVFESITEELRDELFREGVTAETLSQPVRTMDLCYVGQSSLLTVPADPLDKAAQTFEVLHRQHYGYHHAGRAIQIHVARVELAARAPRSRVGRYPVESDRDCDETSRVATPHTTEMVVAAQSPCKGTQPPCKGSRRQSVPLFFRHQLVAGFRFQGPAMVIEPTSTIVVDPGFDAVVKDTGDLLLTLQEPPTKQNVSQPRETDDSAPTTIQPLDNLQEDNVPSRGFDPVRLELFANQFTAIAEQMGATLQRTALSVNVKERLDFSCAIFTAQGDLVVNAPHIPVHLGGMSDCVKALIEDVGTFQPGDVYVTNDPYRGGSHLNDITVITPVYDPSGRRLLFFVASRAHHAEIGGLHPGSMSCDATSLAQEGVLIPALPWVQHGQPQQEKLRILLTTSPYPSRAPDDNLADVAAQVAANQTGVRELGAMVSRYGPGAVVEAMRHLQAAAEQKMRGALGRLPDGLFRFTDSLDDGSVIRAAVQVQGEKATVDFSGTAPVHPGNLNANRAIVTSCVLYCFRCLIGEDLPLNAGVLAPIEIILPHCFLNPLPEGNRASMPLPAVAGGNVETSQRIVDCLFGALKTVAASQGTMNNLLMGHDPLAGGLRPLAGGVNPLSYYETICGGAGAGNGFDGADAVHTHMTNTRLTDPEVLERQVPVRLVRFAIRHGSGGQGRYRGGCGVVREFEFLAPLAVTIISGRRTRPPYGLAGGAPGRCGRNLLRRRGCDQLEELPPITHFVAQPGDRLTIETPGGGGWGKCQEQKHRKKQPSTLSTF